MEKDITRTAVGYKRSKFGSFRYKTCVNWAAWLSKHRWLWYLLNFTWGLAYTLFGGAVALGVKLITHTKPFKFCHVQEFKFGNNWGGLSGGRFTFVAKVPWDADYEEECARHEYGHTFQNAMMGPLFIFMVAIPSAYRYWARRLCKNKNFPAYDAIWFEGSATDGGGEAYLTYKNKNNQ